MAKKLLSIGEAAGALGVSADTVRRWEKSGKLHAERDERGRRMIPRKEIERLSERPQRAGTGDQLSARNRFTGIVTSVEVDGVMALVELEAGLGDHTRFGRGARTRSRYQGNGGSQGHFGDG